MKKYQYAAENINCGNHLAVMWSIKLHHLNNKNESNKNFNLKVKPST